MSSVTFVTTVVILLTVLVESKIITNPNWVKPDIYSRSRLSKSSTLNIKSDSETEYSSGNGIEEPIYQKKRKLQYYSNEDLSIYYKKIVKFIIKKSKVKPFSDDDEYLIRTINFKITKQQIEQLENSNDIIELDGLFSDIIHQSEGGSFNSFQEAVLSWSDLITIKSSEYLNWNYVKFLAYISGVMVISFVIGKRFKIHIFLALLVVSGIIRFFGEYQLCNKRKEYEKLASLAVREKNPCELKVPKGIVDYLANWFSGNTKENCIQHLMETYEPQIEFCDPLDVFLDFVHNIIFKHVSNCFVKLGEVASLIIGKVRFPYNMIIMAFFLYIVKDFLITFLKLSFNAIKERFFSTNPAPVNQMAGSSAEHLKELTSTIKEISAGNIEITKATLRLLEHRTKKLIKKMENRVEILPQLSHDVGDEGTDSEITENEDTEFDIINVITEDKEDVVDPSSIVKSSEDTITKKDN